ncbi:MAG: DUF309 domain-containing protein [Vampirovibrionales bacterium]
MTFIGNTEPFLREAFTQWQQACHEGLFFEAHETLEDPLWQGLPSSCPEKRGVQALIQWAVSMAHLKRENRHGAWKLWERATQNRTHYEQQLQNNTEATPAFMVLRAYLTTSYTRLAPHECSWQQTPSYTLWEAYQSTLLPDWLQGVRTTQDTLRLCQEGFKP